MNHVERFRALVNFQDVDRIPRWEWAMWWDKTIGRWHGEGLPAGLTDIFDIHEYFGLDPYKQYWFSTTEATIEAEQHHQYGPEVDGQKSPAGRCGTAHGSVKRPRRAINRQ